MFIPSGWSLSQRSCESRLILVFRASVAGDKFTTIADQTVFLRTAFEETDESLLNLLALCASVHLVPLEISIYGPGKYHIYGDT